MRCCDCVENHSSCASRACSPQGLLCTRFCPVCSCGCVCVVCVRAVRLLSVQLLPEEVLYLALCGHAVVVDGHDAARLVGPILPQARLTTAASAPSPCRPPSSGDTAAVAAAPSVACPAPEPAAAAPFPAGPSTAAVPLRAGELGEGRLASVGAGDEEYDPFAVDLAPSHFTAVAAAASAAAAAATSAGGLAAVGHGPPGPVAPPLPPSPPQAADYDVLYTLPAVPLAEVWRVLAGAVPGLFPRLVVYAYFRHLGW